MEGAVPGWRQSLDAVLGWTDSGQAASDPEENEGFGDAASDKVCSRSTILIGSELSGY